jgi:DNA-directed RNA polymerase
MCRGMLHFAQARPLGDKGLEWLYIQAANLYGANKMSLAMRREFTEENLDKVIDSAERPLDGERWWLDAEEPWQCLSVCMEINRALKSGDPASYMSHLPVHQVCLPLLFPKFAHIFTRLKHTHTHTHTLRHTHTRTTV